MRHLTLRGTAYILSIERTLLLAHFLAQFSNHWIHDESSSVFSTCTYIL